MDGFEGQPLWAGDGTVEEYFCVLPIGVPDPDSNFGQQCNKLQPSPVNQGDPINTGSGNLYEKLTVYRGGGENPLVFNWYYNSQRHRGHWTHSYSRVLENSIGPNDDARAEMSALVQAPYVGAHAVRPDGRTLHFRNRFDWTAFTAETALWVKPAHVVEQLASIYDSGSGEMSGFSLTLGDGSVESYALDGRLQSIKNPAGRTQTLTYDSQDRVESVADEFGHQLFFEYDDEDDLPDALLDNALNRYEFYYEQQQLVKIVYPDETPWDDSDNPTRLFHYENTDFPDYLTGITDENGERSHTWTYDPEGRATSSEHAGGIEHYDLTYNADGTTTVTDPLGRQRTFTLTIKDGVYKVASIAGGACTGCGGNTAGYGYDTSGFLQSQTDQNGNLTTYIYNDRGLQESRTEAVGTPEERTITTQWHPQLRKPALVTEPGRTTAYTYYTDGQVESRTETDTATGEVRTTNYTYHTNGLLATVDGPRTDVNDVTSYTYDLPNYRTTVTNALGQSTQITRDYASGRPVHLLDANGIETQLTYHPRGRLRSRTTAGAATTFTYDAAGNVTRIGLPNGTGLDYTYDAAQRLTDITDGPGNRIHYVLDDMGNRTGETIYDPSGTLRRTRTQVYNDLGRLIEIVGADGQTTSYDYDDNGNRTEISDPQTRLTENEYDALDRLIKVIDPLQGTTLYGYDARDNLTSVEDPGQLTTGYVRNAFGEIVTQTSPDTGTTSYTYDTAGNRLSQTDARGLTTSYVYDALNRLTHIQYPDASLNVTYTYDQGANGIGRLTGMSDASGQTDYGYDAQGKLVRVQTQIGGEGYTIGYGYDLSGNLTRVTYPSGRTVDYTYDTANRVSRVTATHDGQTQTLAENLSYLPFGPLTNLTYGNGLTRTLTYDQDYRLSQIVDGTVLSRGYTYDPSGNITAIVDDLEAARGQSFGYDDLDRLIQASGGYGQLDYDYDAVGNRLLATRDQGGQVASDDYHYAADSHRLASVTGDHPVTFQYDDNGNAVQAHGNVLIYDDRNRLTQVVTPNRNLDYRYNGRGERASKQEGTQTVHYLYDSGGRLLAEHRLDAQKRREYVYLNGQRLAVWVIDESQSGGTPTSLSAGQPVNGSVSQDGWNYYQITASAADTQLAVLLDGLSADADLYVRAGWKPDADHYDCKLSTRGTIAEQCNLSNTGATTWYIAVYGYQAADYTLTASLQQGGADLSPPTVPQNLVATVISHEQIDLSWTASVDNGGGSVTGYHIYRDGTTTPVATVTGTGYSDTGLWWDTDYSYQVAAFDNAIPANESAPSTPATHVKTLPQPLMVLRINAGGAEYTDSEGHLWAADTGYNTGNIEQSSGDIAGTADDALYQVLRWDPDTGPELQYSFAVPTGSYLVMLHLSENYGPLYGMGLRVFDVNMEGARVLEDVDIYSQAGGEKTALVLSVPVNVLDGELNIEFIHQVDNPSVAAIEILEQASAPGDTQAPTTPQDLVAAIPAGNHQVDLSWSPSVEQGGSLLVGYKIYRDGGTAPIATVSGTGYSDMSVLGNTTYSYQVSAFDNAVPVNESVPSTPASVTTPPWQTTVLRINAGGGDYTDGDGNLWSADTGFNTGSSVGNSVDIAGTTDDVLYRTIRWDPGLLPEMQYAFAVPNGSYLVKLHLAEINSGTYGPGLRVFDVNMEGARVLDDVDIYDQVGAETALVLSVPVTVADGELTIDFIHQVENPSVSAIEILEQVTNPADTTPPTQPQGLVGTAVSDEQIDLSWSPSVEQGGSTLVGYRIYRDGGAVPIATVTGTHYSDTDVAENTTYSYQVTAFDSVTPANESAPSTALSITTPLTPIPILRINAGGGDYTDGSGNLWSADTGYNTGSIATSGADITRTTDDTLYQSLRWDPGSVPELQYAFTVPTGSYTIKLHFSENYVGTYGTGLRVFDVNMEGARVLDDVDIYDQVGAETALVLSVPVSVVDGELNIEFLHQADNPSIAAIEILQRASMPGDTLPPTQPQDLTATAVSDGRIDLSWSPAEEQGGSALVGYRIYRNGDSTPIATVTGTGYSDTGVASNTSYSYQVTAFDNATPANESVPSTPANVTTPPPPVSLLRINAGGGAYTDGNGHLWSADTGYNTGGVATSGADIAGTTDDALYQTLRWDTGAAPELQYALAVPNGSYLVKLHLTETWSGAYSTGRRVFDVNMEGTRVLDDVDIYAQVGAEAALVLSVPVTVTDGELNIEFIHQVDNPAVSAIEVLQ